MKNLLKIKLPHTKVIIAILVAITTILIIGIYFWLQKNKGLLEPSFIPQFPLEKKTGIKQLPTDQLPRLLPPDIPLEKDALILQNYSQVIKNKEQATRQFLSSKSLKENFEIYQNYIKKANWSIINTIDGPDLKSLSAKKERPPYIISITVSKNKQTTQTIVNITLVGPALIFREIPGH